MKLRSPTLEGFRAVFGRPSFVLAEIAWRWSVGIAAASLFGFALLEYLDTLPVSGKDIFFLRTGQPPLVAKAIHDIFRGSAARAVGATILLAISISLAWIVVASLGRISTVRALYHHFRSGDAGWASFSDLQPDWALAGGWRSLAGLNFLRIAASVAAVTSFVGSIGLVGAISEKSNSGSGSATLILFMLAMFIWIAWSIVNWFLSLSSIFVVGKGSDTFGAVTAAVNLCCQESGSVAAAGFWFGLAHIAAFVIGTSVVAFPLGFARVLPGGVVFGGVLLVTMLYFAIADFLYVGRLAAYIAMVELPDAPPPPVILPPPNPVSTIEMTGRVDPEELILSDVPTPPESGS